MMTPGGRSSRSAPPDATRLGPRDDVRRTRTQLATSTAVRSGTDPAVERKSAAGRIAALVAEQPCSQGGLLVGGRVATQGDAGLKCLSGAGHLVFAGDKRLREIDQPGGHVTWADRVHPDAVPSDLERCRTDKSHDRVLRGHIGSEILRSPAPRARTRSRRSTRQSPRRSSAGSPPAFPGRCREG